MASLGWMVVLAVPTLRGVREAAAQLLGRSDALLGRGATRALLLVAGLAVAGVVLSVLRDLLRGVAVVAFGETAEHRAARAATRQISRDRAA